MSGGLKVKIFDAQGTQTVSVPKSTLTIGSAHHCDVVLDQTSVLGEHLRVWLDGGKIWAQDLGSSSGSYLNGARLPSLKPMLVREVDTIRLGESSSMLGLEPVLVRSPVVRTVSPTLPTLPSVPPQSEPRSERDDIKEVSRELAEVKLQLQMSQLDRAQVDESAKQITSLRDQVHQLSEQRRHLSEALEKQENEKQKFREALEAEMSEIKLKALKEVKELKETETRKFYHFKVEALADLTNQIHHETAKLLKSWGIEELNEDRVAEWEGRIQKALRKVLNGDVAASGSEPRQKADKSQGHHVVQGPKAVTASPVWLSYVNIGMVGVLVVAALGLMYPYVSRAFLRPSAQVASVASSAARAVTSAGPVEANGSANVSAGAGKDKIFHPAQTKDYKKTYTENILFTENYLNRELSSSWRRKWLADLNKAAKADWKLEERVISELASKENALLQDLSHMRAQLRSEAGIRDMRAREDKFVREVQSLLGTRTATERFFKLKRSFHSRNQGLVSQKSR